MGYIVQYGEPVPESVPVRALRHGTWIAILAMLICSAAAGFLVRGELRERLFPWTQDSVQSAFAEFREELREGDPFVSSFEDFCRDVIADGSKIS